MQLTIELCSKCKKTKCCKQKQCVTCRGRSKQSRLKHIQTERDYQSKRWAYRACVHSRIADKNANRTYKSNTFITPPRLEFLRTLQQNECIYCHTTMQIKHRRKPDGLTVERIDGNKPHIKNNVALCCFRCNCKSGRGRPGIIIQQVFSELRDKVPVLSY